VFVVAWLFLLQSPINIPITDASTVTQNRQAAYENSLSSSYRSTGIAIIRQKKYIQKLFSTKKLAPNATNAPCRHALTKWILASYMLVYIIKATTVVKFAKPLEWICLTKHGSLLPLKSISLANFDIVSKLVNTNTTTKGKMIAEGIDPKSLCICGKLSIPGPIIDLNA